MTGPTWYINSNLNKSPIFIQVHCLIQMRPILMYQSWQVLNKATSIITISWLIGKDSCDSGRSGLARNIENMAMWFATRCEKRWHAQHILLPRRRGNAWLSGIIEPRYIQRVLKLTSQRFVTEKSLVFRATLIGRFTQKCLHNISRHFLVVLPKSVSI